MLSDSIFRSNPQAAYFIQYCLWIDYERRLERLKSLKAKERMSEGGKGCRMSDKLRTDEIAAHKLGIGGKDTYCKEKYIVDNKDSLTPDDLQDENSKLRALISNNFGRRKNDPAKDRRALATYVSLRAYKQGGTGSNQYMQTCQNGTSAKSTLDEIAKELNMSKRNLTDSMKDLLDTGEITKTFASDTIAYLTEEQEELISKLDETKKYIQKQIDKYMVK